MLGPIGVATHSLVSRHGLACLGSRPELGVASKPRHGEGSWCRDMGLVSRQGKVVGGVATHAHLARGDSAQRARDTTPSPRRQPVACARQRAHCAHDPPTAVHCVVHCFGSLFGTLFLDIVSGSLFIKKKKKLRDLKRHRFIAH